MDADDKTDIEQRLSLIEERARARRKRTAILTFAPVIVTGAIVLVLAREVASKRLDLQQLEEKARGLEAQVRDKQREREQLEGENKQLEERKKLLQRFIEKLHEPSGGPSASLAPERSPEARETESVIVSQRGDVPAAFSPEPRVTLNPRKLPRGREVVDVTLSLDVPEPQREAIESVTYDLNKDWYGNNQFSSSDKPTYDARFTVYECLGTVLVTVKLKNGSSTAVALDWCKNDGWPKPPQNIGAPEPEPAPLEPPGTGPGRPNRPPGDNRPPPKTDSPTRPK
jgi:cell division protein FtsL